MIRIALVEDDPAYAEQLLSYLKEYEKESKERISVQTFSDGEDIVTEYRADYDIILMDVMMPVMNGLEASKQIRSLSRPDGNMIPILAMTAQDAISVSSQCRQYGMDDYVLKPADPEQLTKMILKYVKTI